MAVMLVTEWRQWEHLMTVGGATEQERNVADLKDEYMLQIENNPGYEAHAKRNGIEQPMLFTRGEVRYKMNVAVNPGDELYPGDLVEAYGETWLCTETRAMDTLQVTGLLWLCNHKFRWQNFTSDILECWGILDSGVYSTTKNGDDQLQYLDKQYKIYLPYNEDTAKIFVDKRIATEVMYNQFGEQILATYAITGVDHTSRSYGKGAHLLILNARSDTYNATTDNLGLMLCDYISPEHKPPKRKGSCAIDGRKTIRPGNQNVYTPVFSYEATPIWTVGNLPDGVTYELTDGTLVLAANKQVYVGQKILITLQDEAKEFEPATIEVEVTAYG